MSKEAEKKNPTYGKTPLDEFLPGGYLSYRQRIGPNEFFQIERVSTVKDKKSRKIPRFT